MLNRGNHIIKKQVLDIYTDTQEDVWQLQNRIRSIYYEKMLPLIEEACNNYDTGEIVRIDKLTIDLGEISSKKLDEEMVRVLEGKINEQLSKVIFQAKTGNASGNVRVEKISPNISDLELVATFLKTGVLPWWKKNMTSSEIESIFIQQIQKNSKVVKLFLAKHLRYDAVLKRITFQFSEETIEKLIVLIWDDKKEKVEQLLKELKSLFRQLAKKENLPSKTMFIFWQELIRISVENALNTSSEKYILEKLIEVFERSGIQSKGVLIRSIYKIIHAENQSKSQKKHGNALLKASEILLREMVPESAIDIIKTVRNTREDSNKKDFIDSKEEAEESPEISKRKQTEANENLSEKDSADKSVSKDKKNAQHVQQKDKEKSQRIDSQKKQTPEFNLETVEEVYIRNAGLVLIWNYLPFYFKHIGLVDDGEFVNEQARHRAAHLLQYIVTGEESVPEFELPLNKLLCGISLSEPLEKVIQVTEAEKAEAEVMLQTAINHWGALGESSPLALRQSFLNREGMLIKDEKSWILRVEESAIDILLDKLPWSYSIVNFKWMEKPIYVEWR